MPNWWIGLNCLDLEPDEVAERADSTAAGL